MDDPETFTYLKSAKEEYEFALDLSTSLTGTERAPGTTPEETVWVLPPSTGQWAGANEGTGEAGADEGTGEAGAHEGPKEGWSGSNGDPEVDKSEQ